MISPGKSNGAAQGSLGRKGVNPWIVAVILSIAAFMEVLDTAIANVALRHIAGGLSAGLDESTWVLTSYLVANGIVLPISGWLATAFGRKRFYMICVFLFTVSSLLCGLSASLNWLIFFRVLQGLGGGGLAPSEQSILADSFPQEKHGQVFALYGVAVVVAPAIGPTLGGWITDNFSWHWIFLINVPIGIASLLLCWFLVPDKIGHEAEDHIKKSVHIDYTGFAFVALGLGALQVVLDKGEREDWFASNFILIFCAIAVISLTFLVWWELTHPDPAVDIALFKDRSFLASNMVMFAVGFILYGSTQLLPQFMQTVMGYTATKAGLAMTPGGFATMSMMPVVGILVGRIQPRWLVATGLLIEAAALYHMTTFTGEISFRHAMWARIFQAAGLGFLFVPINSVAYIGLPSNRRNNASALINLSRNMGGSFGISLAQTWLARRTQFHQVRITEHTSVFNFAYVEKLKQITKSLIAHGESAISASNHSVAILYETVQRQASILAYVDIFWLLSIGALVMVSLVFLLRSRPKGVPLQLGH